MTDPQTRAQLVDILDNLSASVRLLLSLATIVVGNEESATVGTAVSAESANVVPAPLHEVRAQAGRRGAQVTNAKRWGRSAVSASGRQSHQTQLEDPTHPAPKGQGVGGGDPQAANADSANSSANPASANGIGDLDARRAADRAAAAQCGACDEEGWIVRADGSAMRCTHDQAPAR